MISMNDTIEKLRKKPVLVYGCIAGLVFIMVILQRKEPVQSNPGPTKYAKKNSDIGLGAGGIDQKSYLTRLEKSYFEAQDRMKELEKQMKKMEQNQQSMSESVLKLNDNFTQQINRQQDLLNKNLEIDPSLTAVSSPMQLAIAQVAPVINQEDQESVYLPLGSFCKGTLLTGVYAAADQNNPLPVLIRLDEAFYGPNQSRIPLRGALALGRAYGDLVSQRALIQVVAISTVLPDGSTVEHEQNLGYITDSRGELGIQGRVIRNTGRQLALSFMTGFMSGGSQALADQEVSRRTTEGGSVISEVSGNMVKNASFSGLAKSSGKMSDYYAKQAEDLVPAVHVENGQEVYFIVQKGVTIHGLSRRDDVVAYNRF